MKLFIEALTKKENRKLIASFFLFLLFILLGVFSLVRGIADQDLKRIIISALGTIGAGVLFYIIVKLLVKSTKKPVLPEPVKKGKKSGKK